MSKRQIQPYLNFDGRCEEAIEFYRKALGAEVLMLMRWKDAPGSESGPNPNGDKVMHAEVRIGDSTILASDGDCGNTKNFSGVRLSLTVPDAADSERCFKALSQGGSVEMPLTKTFFSPSFGMLSDRFGLGWMVYVASTASTDRRAQA